MLSFLFLALEYVGPEYRTVVANMSIGIFLTAGSISTGWIAYGIANWRYLCYIVSAPMLLALITPFFVPESARWAGFRQVNASLSNVFYLADGWCLAENSIKPLKY